MKKLEELTSQDILDMDYNNIISVVKETNRVPGGYATLQEIANVSGIKRGKKVLEIGTSTGITAIELARLTECQIEAIDINERSIYEAKERADLEGVSRFINFSVQDATNLNFEDVSFDFVFCGNVTSLIPDRIKAKEEYFRVLKNGGFLAAVPMYYINNPTSCLLQKVRDAIKSNVEIVGKDYWIDFYRRRNMCFKYSKDFKFEYIDDETLNRFIDYILKKPHLKVMNREAYKTLCAKYREYIYLFRENLSCMGYSIILQSKEIFNDEPELFVGKEILNI